MVGAKRLKPQNLWEKLLDGSCEVEVDVVVGRSSWIIDVEYRHLALVRVLDDVREAGRGVDCGRSAENQDEVATRDERLYAIEFGNRLAEPHNTWSK